MDFVKNVSSVGMVVFEGYKVRANGAAVLEISRLFPPECLAGGEGER